MSRRGDPGWLRMADRLFGGLLWLFPKPLRDAHGQEMRQAFRDRCREVARGERSALRVFAMELLPDTLRSAGREQWSASFEEMRPQQFLALALLCCAATGLLFQERLSRATLDLVFDAKYALRNYSEAREALEQEAQVRRLADFLSANGDVESKALSAFAYRVLYTSREQLYQYGDDRGRSSFVGKVVADGDRSNSAAIAVLGSHPDIYPFAIALRACDPTLGCNRALAIQQLTERDPDNAYAWSLAFESASQKGDHTAMGDALARMGRSSHYQSYGPRVLRDLFESARKLAPDDQAFLAAIVMQTRAASYSMVVGDYRHSVRWNCSATPSGDPVYISRWIQAAPKIRPDCLAVARLLSRSSSASGAYWGWQQIYLQDPDSGARARAFQNLRNARWLWAQSVENPGATRQVDGSWREWTATDWTNWRTAWATKDGEIPALKRWLASQGRPVEAPADYQMPPP